MDTIKSKYHETLAATVIKNLEKRQMEGYYCPTVEDAEKLAFSFLKDGQTVSFGGSMTLEETGMLTALRHDPSIHLIDRSTAKTPDETKKMYHDALSSDVYFMSTNAHAIFEPLPDQRIIFSIKVRYLCQSMKFLSAERKCFLLYDFCDGFLGCLSILQSF